MKYNKDILFCTIAFGSKRYFDMAVALKNSFEKNNPEFEFKIFDESFITPKKIHLKDKKKIYPKDLKYAKFEILKNLNKPNKKYVFIDADSIVLKNLSYLTNFIKKNCLTIEYKYDGNEGWSKIPRYNFVKCCNEAGLHHIEPYSLNGGFMMWEGKINCFEKTIEFLKKYDLKDSKGLTGEEYYLCAAIQYSKTNIFPINYNKIKLLKLWNFDFKENNLKITIDNDFVDHDIIHYGNFNFYNIHIQKIIKFYNSSFKLDVKEYLITMLKLIKKMVFNCF